MGLRVSPFAFTEHGVIMLASILNSDKAIKVNLQIVRIFIRMCENDKSLSECESVSEEKRSGLGETKIDVDYTYELKENKLFLTRTSPGGNIKIIMVCRKK